MSTSYSSIDYTDMISELKEDLDSGFINSDDELYIIRQNTPVTLSTSSEVFYPVLDYLYSEPKLKKGLAIMPIAEIKRKCYALLDDLEHGVDCPFEREACTQVIEEITKSLGDYTKGKSKRNDEPVSIILTEAGDIPFAFFYDSDDASDTLEMIKASELLQELERCNQG